MRFTLVLLILAAPAQAQDARGGVMVPVSDRLFLLGERPPAESTNGQVRLTSVAWIAAIVAADPLLAGSELFLVPTEVDASLVLGPDGMRAQGLAPERRDLDAVPDEQRVEGFVAEAGLDDGGSVERLAYWPDGPETDILVGCHLDYGDGPWDGFCVVHATYAPDLPLVLAASWFAPLPAARVAADARAVADRLREIAGCLDVTDHVPEDPAARLAEIRRTNPTLEDCSPALTS